MKEPRVFYQPPRQPGINLHIILITLLTIASIASLWLVFSLGVGSLLIFFLVLAFLVTFPIPLLIYRLYALLRGLYSLDRDTLFIQWGLRSEEIPISDVEWVRPATALTMHLPMPFLRLSGSIIGTRRHSELGIVEFMSSTTATMLLVATKRRVYAISPTDAAGFVQDFQRAIELGSLSQKRVQSVYPSFVFAQAWKTPLTRFLWLSGFFLNVGLLAWVSSLAPSLTEISLGFLPDKTPQPPSAGVQIMLLPFISIFLFLVNWLVGLYFHRTEQRRPMAYVLWGASIFTAILFLVAVFFILNTTV